MKKTKILNIYLIFYNYIYIIIKYDFKIHFLAEKRAKMSYCNCNFVIFGKCLPGLDLGRFSINLVLRFEPTGCGLNETRKGTQSHTADDAVKLGRGRKETRWQT